MIFAYFVPILLVLIIYRYWQLKKSIRRKDYDYSYYEDGPWGKKKAAPKGWLAKIKKALGLPALILGLGLGFSLQSCQPEPPLAGNDYNQGVFCVNEGIFGQTSGTISHYNPNTKETTFKIFNLANNRDLGDVVQSMTIIGQDAFIVVNNSNKIEIVDAITFEEKNQITGLELPRYIVSDGNKAFVSQWGADGLTGSIASIHLASNIITSIRPIGKGPEQLLLHNNKLYIPNAGGYDVDNRLMIMDAQNDSILDTIIVDDRPSSCLADANGAVWILCGGNTVYASYRTIDLVASTESSLIKIDATNDSIILRKTFGKGRSAQNLTIDKTANKIYYTRENKIWQYDIDTDTEIALISGSFYGLDYNPNDNYIYATTNSGINAAYAKRYQTDGTFVDSFGVGVFANGFVFK